MKKLSICMLIGMLAFGTAACGGKTVQEPVLQESTEEPIAVEETTEDVEGLIHFNKTTVAYWNLMRFTLTGDSCIVQGRRNNPCWCCGRDCLMEMETG